MRGYSRLPGWSLKVRYLALFARAWPLCGSIYSHDAAAVRLPAREDTSRISSPSSCRPARGWRARRATTDAWSYRDDDPPRYSSVFVLGGTTRRVAWRCARRRCSCISCPRAERNAAAEAPEDHRSPTSSPTFPIRASGTCYERGERELSFSMLSNDGDAALASARSSERVAPASGLPQRCRHRRHRPAGAARDAEIRRRGRLGVAPRRSPRRFASRPSATSTPTLQSSTRAIGWCRSACRSRRARAPTCSCCKNLRVAERRRPRDPAFRRRRYRFGRGPTVSTASTAAPRRHRRRPAPRYALGEARETFYAWIARTCRRRLAAATSAMRDPGRGVAGFVAAMGAGLMMVFGVLILLFGSFASRSLSCCRCRSRSAAWCWRSWRPTIPSACRSISAC